MKNNIDIEKIKEVINSSYKSYHCGYTEERSHGNYADCFNDGYDCGASNLAYEIGWLLGMELDEPEEPMEEEW